jgi:hypothetical protein
VVLGYEQELKIMIGDDTLYRGEKADSITNSYYHHYAARFGFSGTAYNDMASFSMTASVISGPRRSTDSHSRHDKWYRFIATLDLANATYDVNVYDMGTQHSINAETPETPVETFSGNFRRPIGDTTHRAAGHFAISLAAYGMREGTPEPIMSPARQLRQHRADRHPAEQEPVVIYRIVLNTNIHEHHGQRAAHPLAGAIDTSAEPGRGSSATTEG